MKTPGACGLLVLAVVSCAAAPESAIPLDGTWTVEIPAKNPCVGGFTFSWGTYVDQLLCSVGSPAVVLSEITTGRFTEDGRTMTMTPEKSSCPERPRNRRVFSLEYSLTGDTLLLSEPASGTMALMVRSPASGGGSVDGGGSVIQAGCLETSGQFAPGGVRSVR